MARTPLFARLQEMVSTVTEAEGRHVPVEQVAAERAAHRRTRRELLRDAGTAGAALTAAGTLTRGAPSASAATVPRIVVVGAGLAGLSCAYRLKQAGLTAQVYEASDRVGGRCWTLRGAFDQAQIAEHGGELIDQSHTSIRQLANQLGLTLDNLLSAEQNGTEQVSYFDGEHYTCAEATADIKEIWQKMHADVSAASYPTLYNNFTPRGYELDHLSIVDWINETVPGGIKSKLGQLLDVAYNIEYDAESNVQSSLNLLYLLAYSGQGQLRIFGPSNEKYHVAGGNDQITARLAAALGGQITRSSELISMRQNTNGTYTLTFAQGLSTTSVTADRVVLAIPFSILRSSVDYSRDGFSNLKKIAIEEQGMGTNSKLHLQFKTRHWRSLGSNGKTFSDRGYQNTWEVTRAQFRTAGILVDYTGGKIGASFGSGTATTRAQQFLAQIDPVLPGLSKQWNGKAALDFWTGYPWTKGSYSYWKVGQYTKFAGVEREQQGTCHFAGEHTSVDFQGYLNGAVETGERVVSEILADLK
jgi:monoamine oxidase